MTVVARYGTYAARLAPWIAVAFIAAVHVYLISLSFTTTAVDVDEGYSMSIVLNLANGQGLRSDGVFEAAPPQQFEAAMSTGPTILLPPAGLVALGMDVFTASRIVGTVGYIALVAASAALGWKVSRTWGAILGAAAPAVLDLFTATNSPLAAPGVLLGEYAAAAFMALSLVLLPRSRFWAGVAAGLAVVTKVIASAMVPGLAVAFLLLAWKTPWASRLRGLVVGAAGVAAPLVLYEAIKLLVLGPMAYKALVHEYIARGQLERLPTPLMWLKTGYLSDAWFLPAPIAIGSLVAAAAVAGFALARASDAGRAVKASRAEYDAVRAGVSPGFGVPVSLAVGGVVMGLMTLGSWMLLRYTDPTWIRHPSPGLLLGFTAAAAGLAGVVRFMWPDRDPASWVLSRGAVLMMILLPSVSLLLHVKDAELPGRFGYLGQERELADLVVASGTTTLQGQWGPMVPIAALADIPARNVREELRPGELILLDMTHPNHPTDNNVFYRDSLCGDIVLDGPVLLCWPKNDAVHTMDLIKQGKIEEVLGGAGDASDMATPSPAATATAESDS